MFSVTVEFVRQGLSWDCFVGYVKFLLSLRGHTA